MSSHFSPSDNQRSTMLNKTAESCPMVPFGDILEIAPRELAEDRVLPVMSITMKDGLVDQEAKFKKRIASSDISGYKVVQKGNLVVGFPIDEGVLGFQSKYEAAAVSPAYDIWTVTGQHPVDRRYFEQILRSPAARLIYAAKMRGTTNRRRTIPKEIFKKICFPLPPLEEQKRIAGILDAADALRARRRESLAQLDTLLQSTFLDMFGDPVTNPMGWDVVPITEAVDGKYGIKAGPFGSALKKQDYVASGFRVYGQEQVIAGRFDIGDYYIDERKFKKLENCAVAAGDILVSLVGSYGKVLIVSDGIEPGIINPRLLKITPRQELVTSLYLATLIQNDAIQRKLEGMSHGGTMGILNAGLLKQLTVPTPPLEVQHRFAAIVESVEQQKAAQRAHLDELDTLFACLQQRAFAGELVA